MILGIIGFSICALELVGLIPYELQLNVFNPIQDFVGLDFATLKYHLEVFAKDHAVDNDTLEILKGKLDEYLPPIFLGATVEAGVYAVSCLLMLIGACCKVRGLMIPYLILQMLVLIVTIATGGLVSALYFLLAPNMEENQIGGGIVLGCIAAGVTLILAILLIYFWLSVQRAYVELGNNEYMYSPAPMKPSYNDGRAGYYPTSPQHFQMDERK